MKSVRSIIDLSISDKEIADNRYRLAVFNNSKDYKMFLELQQIFGFKNELINKIGKENYIVHDIILTLMILDIIGKRK